MNRFYGYMFVMLLLSLMVTPAVRARRYENPLAELSTRSELVELAGYGEEKLSSVEVVGTVVCEACSDGAAGSFSLPISGALVAVTCKKGRKMKTHLAAKTETNEYGDFIIDLPSHLHAIPDMEKACFVKILRLPRSSPCTEAPPSFMRIRFLSNRHNTRTYTTVENIRLQPTSGHAIRCLKKRNNAAGTTW